MASQIGWLASPLCCTPWPVLQNVRQDTGSPAHTTPSQVVLSRERSFHALSLRHRLISGSFRLPSRGAFQLSITLLLRYRSQDIFSLGGKCPPVSREISDPRYSSLRHIQQTAVTGLSPSTVPRSRGVDLMLVRTKRRAYNTTSPHPLRGGIRFGLCCVHSPLLTASHIDFSSCPYADVSTQGVPDLYQINCKMQLGVPIRTSRDQRFHAPPPGLSQLGTSFIGS